MLGRLLERGKTSGREDDEVNVIKKRFSEWPPRLAPTSMLTALLNKDTYKSDTMPVIEYYNSLSKLAEVCSGIRPSLVLIFYSDPTGRQHWDR